MKKWGAGSLAPFAQGGVRSGSREAGPWRPRAPLPRQPAGSPVPTSSPRMLQLPFAKGVRAALPLLKIFEMCQADGPTLISRSCVQMASFSDTRK